MASPSSAHSAPIPSASPSPAPTTAAAASSPSSSSASPRSALPSRNPLPLSAAQEAQVRTIYHKNLRTICAPEIKGRSFSMAWACRTQNHIMQTCIKQNATLDQEDRAREEWFATRQDRRHAHDVKEEQREARLKLYREGLPEDVKRQLEAEDMANAAAVKSLR